jgi:hypothetical protein
MFITDMYGMFITNMHGMYLNMHAIFIINMHDNHNFVSKLYYSQGNKNTVQLYKHWLSLSVLVDNC